MPGSGPLLSGLLLALLSACSFRDLSDLDRNASGDAGAAGSSENDAGAAGASLDCNIGSTDLDCLPLRLDTAYLVHPSEELTSCVQVTTGSLAANTPLVLAACQGAITQKFWFSVEQDQRVSLRSARSGLCLQPLPGESGAGTTVVQAPCLGLPAQLWSLLVANEDFSLVHEQTGLHLGATAQGNLEQPSSLMLVAASEPTSKTWQLEPVAGGTVTLEPLAAPSGFLSRVTGQATVLFDDDSVGRWRVLPGLADPSCITLELAFALGSFLRHSDYLLWVDPTDDTAGFARDATFCFGEGKSQTGDDLIALEALNYPDYFITQGPEGQARLERLRDFDEQLERATFRLRGN